MDGYTYDVVGRLTGATVNTGNNPAPAYSYTYDANGNLLSEDLNGTPHTFAYNPANGKTSSDGAAVSYDLDGDELGSTAGRSLAYNTQDQTTVLPRHLATFRDQLWQLFMIPNSGQQVGLGSLETFGLRIDIWGWGIQPYSWHFTCSGYCK